MITFSYRIEGGDYDSAGLASRLLKEQLARAGVSAAAMRRAMIAAYEAEMNVVIHARTGTLWARVEDGRLDLEVADEGPGIPDVDAALREGWSTAPLKARAMGFGAGLGLPNIRRSSDFFQIETRVGRGTRIRSTILLAETGAGLPQEAPDAAPPGVDAGRCRRCMRCIMACPTGAIRVRSTGPFVIQELCVGCAACAGACECGVYSIPAPQGPHPVQPGTVLVVPRIFLCSVPVPGGAAQVVAALHAAGYATVRLLEEWEEALRLAAGGEGTHAPVVAALCPPVLSLVESRFPSLIPQLGPWLSPAEAAGEEFPLQPLVVMAACPGQASCLRRSSLTGRLSIQTPQGLLGEIRPFLAETPSGIPTPDDAWRAGHEPAQGGRTLRARGAAHVLRALAEAEAGRLHGVSVLDCALCEGGCSGSPYLTDDWCVAEQRWPRDAALIAAGPVSASAMKRSRPYAQRPGVRLDPVMAVAIGKLARIDALARTLPGRDCGACGAPSCAAFAEDVVMERAGGEACPHVKETQ